jgi:nucleoside-diphosphate-sugar epimerase
VIIGQGDIAQQLWRADKPFITFFASGVSNSKQQDETEYQREISLLLKQPKDQHLVYFSSLCIYYSQTRYAQHKVAMERLIKENFQTYTIVRLGNITWGRNPNTVINFFKWKHCNKEAPQLEDGYRFVITDSEFCYWMQHLPIGIKNEMNIPGEMVSINEIWRRVQDGKY